MSTINIDRIDIEEERIQKIIDKAISEGGSHKPSFTPETIQSLLDYIKELESALQDEVKFVRSLGENEAEKTWELMVDHEIPFD